MDTTEHALLAMPRLDPEASLSGKCRCGRHLGAHPGPTELEAAFQAHLAEVQET